MEIVFTLVEGTLRRVFFIVPIIFVKLVSVQVLQFNLIIDFVIEI